MEREISILLKVRGAKAAKKAVNDVFDGQTKNLVEGFNKNTKKTGDNMNRVSKTSKKAGKSMTSFTKVLGRGMAALYLYNRAWQTFGRNFEQGMQLERASDQFERHVGNVAKMLPTLRSATRGVIADFDLLKTAQRAFQQGIRPEQMSKTFKMATVAAQRLGLQAADAIKTITKAITTQDEGALETLGIVTKVNQAYQTQAALIAKNGGVMSKAMSIQLRQSLIYGELNKRFGKGNEIQQDGLMVLERLRAAWKNFRAETGQTLGIALRPLMQALTGVLNVTTRLLDRMNDSKGFRTFIGLATTLAGIWAGAKFVGAIKGLSGLLGMFQGGAAAKGITKVSGALKSLKAGLLGTFAGGKVKSIKGVLSGILSMTKGIIATGGKLLKWGIWFQALTVLIEPVGKALAKVWQMGKVFFQLVSNYDAKTGMSKALKKDADALGDLFHLTSTLSKGFIKLMAIVRGVGSGMAAVFQPLVTTIEWGSDRVMGFARVLGLLDEKAASSSRKLKTLEERFKTITKLLGSAYVGGKAGALIGSAVPGVGTAVGGVVGAGLGLAVAGENKEGRSSRGEGSQFRQDSPLSLMRGTGIGAQTSTARDVPPPRESNLNFNEDQREITKKILKTNERQLAILERSEQKEEIKESQRNAQANVFRSR